MTELCDAIRFTIVFSLIIHLFTCNVSCDPGVVPIMQIAQSVVCNAGEQHMDVYARRSLLSMFRTSDLCSEGGCWIHLCCKLFGYHW